MKNCQKCNKSYINKTNAKFCLGCKKIRKKEISRKWVLKNPDYCKNYHKKNAIRERAYNINYEIKNRDKILKKKKVYYRKNKVKIIKYSADFKKYKMKTDPRYRISSSISTLLRIGLGKNKKGISWPQLLGYDSIALKKHLESRFQKGMNWDNYGIVWQIDHIKPRRYFKFSSFKDQQFKECWDINNLRPLWKEENVAWKKYDKNYFNKVVK